MCKVSEADVPDVEKAVQAAHAAFTSGEWRKISATRRGELLYKLADLIKFFALELRIEIRGTINVIFDMGWA
ncbi:aldehyde dehydrogenase family protein [Nostoc sp. C117]|uniref:aldehyde dehydrogenase family protein n=1 Tax=Nostoc sp. C117 TaxID=3349875 RepID=UPI00370D7DDC